MAYALFKKSVNGVSQNFPFEIFMGEQYTSERSRMLRSRPPSSGPRELRSEFSKLEKMLHLIDADCNQEKYRAIIWAIES